MPEQEPLHAERPVPGGTLRVALDWEVDTIDPPASFGGWNTGRVVQQLFESLVEDDLQDEDSACTRLVPALAEGYECSPDGLTYTFHLRRGVCFHDGTEFDAYAVKCNLERMWDSSSPYYYALAADYNQVAMQSLAGIEVLDRHTVQLRLREPFPEMLRCMTQEDAPGAVVFISPKALAELGNEGVGDRAPGTGPFRFKERFHTADGAGVSVVRNDDYWGARPHLDGIDFVPIPDAGERARALVDGEVDLAYGPEPVLLDDLRKRGFVVREGPVPYIWYFIFNTRSGPFVDRRVRQAVAFAFDRARLNETFGSGTRVAGGVLPPASPSFDASYVDPYTYDPELARSLLREAGLADGFSSQVRTARAGSGQLEPVRICEYLREDLARVGINLDIFIEEDWITYCEDWRRGLPEGAGLSQMSWGMSCDVWLEQVTHSKFASPKGFNAGYYSNVQLDQILDSARTDLRQEERTRLYREAQRLLMNDMALLPVLTIVRGLVVHSPNVQNFRFPRQNWHDFRQVWLAV